MFRAPHAWLWSSRGVGFCRSGLRAVLLVAAAATAALAPARGDSIWVEGESARSSTVVRHPFWYDQVKRESLSGQDFISHWSAEAPGVAEYGFEVPRAGVYHLWARVNPINATMSYRLNGQGDWTAIDLGVTGRDSVNIAADDKPDLRFLAWFPVGDLELPKGPATLAFRFESENNHHGYLDCFVLSTEAIRPRGTLQPGQLEDEARAMAEAERDWFAFDPEEDPLDRSSPIDLRWLNEENAGDGGVIAVDEAGHFIHSDTGQAVRFWAVNGPSEEDIVPVARQAQILAKRGVNLARVHHGYYDSKTGELRPEAVQRALETVAALKAEGIYTHLSIYFPLWLTPEPGLPWLEGYDGSQHPFAALQFNPDFQAKYREWWQALLTTPHRETGLRLVDDPAVMGLEIQNEDSYFFWTFQTNNIPDPQLRLLEAQFGDWLKERYGSIEKALTTWNSGREPRDAPEQGRVGFRPLWNMANERNARDQDTARFLAESQYRFYRQMYEFLRSLGFKGVITASNWITADPVVLGPLEKLTYTAGDFIDRHGYFGGVHTGDNAAWSIRPDHVYSHRSAYRFEGDRPGGPPVFTHPAFDVHYAGKPSMISETTWTRPNRYRSEAPLYYAAYGALQDSDAIVHFAFDGAEWAVKPRFFMQPWTLMAPTQMGQFPAAALVYRKGLIAPGELLVDLNLKVDDLLALKGTPLPQDASLDLLRLADVPAGGATAIEPGKVIDPLVHLAGRTHVRFTKNGGPSKVANLAPYIDREGKTVASTNGQVRLDYGRGVLILNAPAAQGAGGDLQAAGVVKLKDLTIESDMDLIHVVAVALDGEALATSERILLQVMTEEQPTGFRTEPAGEGLHKIIDIGRDPWRVRRIEKTVVKLDTPGASALKVTALDPNGTALETLAGDARSISLRPDVVYYLLAP